MHWFRHSYRKPEEALPLVSAALIPRNVTTAEGEKVADLHRQKGRKIAGWFDRAARALGSTVGTTIVLTKPWLKAGSTMLSDLGQAITKRGSPLPRGDVIPTNQNSRERLKKQELFSSQNHGLCKLTEYYYPLCHFLDLSQGEQQTIRQLYQKQISVDEKKDASSAVSESVSNSTKKPPFEAPLERTQTSASTSRRELEIKRLRNLYAGLAPNLKFHDMALARLRAFDQSVKPIFDDKFGLMNLNPTTVADAVPIKTKPQILEVRAGRDYRIYWRYNDRKIEILLVGHKNAQLEDIERL